MKPGPILAKKELLARIDVGDLPKPITDWIADVSLAVGWHTTKAEAREAAERWAPQTLLLLRVELSELYRIGRFSPFAFNSSSPDYLQGSAYIEPKDPEVIKVAKANRAQFNSYSIVLKQLTPREFEQLCAGILSILGGERPVLTPRSADEGIDFYGRLHLEKHMFTRLPFPGLQRQLGVWLVGQAKHYVNNRVSTPEIRELVGAVNLAKGQAFGSHEEIYADLQVRVCDPVFYLFFTTGRLSANSWTLLDRSGVIGMDGEMVAAFLADHGIGIVEGLFEWNAFNRWRNSF